MPAKKKTARATTASPSLRALRARVLAEYRKRHAYLLGIVRAADAKQLRQMAALLKATSPE